MAAKKTAARKTATATKTAATKAAATKATATGTAADRPETRERGTTESSGRLSADERAALKERAQELKAQQKAADGASDVLAKIAEMTASDRRMAERIHAIVTERAPGLVPRTWYGMPAYALRDGGIVCFFQPAQKFGSRYATFGFNDDAALDDGAMWPTSYALTEVTPAEEETIAALVDRAVS